MSPPTPLLSSHSLFPQLLFNFSLSLSPPPTSLSPSMKTAKMTGFLCQSPAATAVCMTGDPRSMIIPKRPNRSAVDRARPIDLRYARLAESRRFALGDKRSLSMSSLAKRDHQPSMASNVASLSSASSSLSSADHDFQVVVMRVSLHCQGCAGKVKKHLSKMEGVTSFSIDLESKRVTVMGHVSPVGVLESISKVKRAEFWPC
ncbi:protein SODIUM POTASSIUM ROOT DEFECTIVE 2-like [Magnolia sinica]|uniref:protein SODIUM POTASSIUM ROOT DEFECTIVE 2-like n=1 Tax=Magnolia sinica TaxID=86752 RepID=UPI0026590893|nr:protein SODIUM POTASSIUM ROOT DEFECTIVE 2-like [Magnolia sinica]